MAVNWQRGLFRLWLVSSALWVGVVAVSMRPDQQLSPLLAPSPITSTSASKPVEDIRPPTKYSEMLLAPPVYNPDKPKTEPEKLVDPFDHLDQTMADRYKTPDLSKLSDAELNAIIAKGDESWRLLIAEGEENSRLLAARQAALVF